MIASTPSDVSTRGLETVLPLPSASIAVISALMMRVKALLKRSSENTPGLKPLRPVAGRLTWFVVVVPARLLAAPVAWVVTRSEPIAALIWRAGLPELGTWIPTAL